MVMQQLGPVGFKALWWDEEQGVFFSFHGAVRWDNNCAVAACLNRQGDMLNPYIAQPRQWTQNFDHIAPAERCDCGIYAVYESKRAMDFIFWWPAYNTVSKIVLIQASGKTIEHDRGFRCERAEILGVLIGEKNGYGVPEIEYGEARELIERNKPIQETNNE